MTKAWIQLSRAAHLTNSSTSTFAKEKPRERRIAPQPWWAQVTLPNYQHVIPAASKPAPDSPRSKNLVLIVKHEGLPVAGSNRQWLIDAS